MCVNSAVSTVLSMTARLLCRSFATTLSASMAVEYEGMAENDVCFNYGTVAEVLNGCGANN